MDKENALIINSSQVVHETIDGETILLNLETGNYFSLDDTGGTVWSLLETGRSVSDIITLVQQHFAEQTDEVDFSISDFITKLIEEELVIPRDVDKTQINSEQSFETLETLMENMKNSEFKAPAIHKYTDMQDLLQLDPIHDVSEDTGWPTAKADEANQDD